MTALPRARNDSAMPRKTTTKTEEKVVELPRAANQAVTPAKPVAAKAVAVEPVPNQPASDETRPNRGPTHEEISRRAYELWVRRGGVGGSAQEDWLRAEQELRGR